MIRTLGFLAIAIACVAFASPAFAGKVYISGHDSDDFGHVSNSFGTQMLDFVGTGNTNGSSGILVLGGTGGQAWASFNTWNAAANGGAGYTVAFASSAAAINGVNFNNYAAIWMPSVDSHTSGGITAAQLALINARAGDIQSFVNGGGNLGALTQANQAGKWGWFPGGALATVDAFYLPVSQTPAMAAAGFVVTDGELNGDLYHNYFTGPPGFFGLQVLATADGTGTGNVPRGAAAILGGGVGTQIVPEPGSLMLLAAAGIFVLRRRRKTA